MAERALVVGVGSEIHRDDRAGRVVATEIEAMRLPGVDVRLVTQLLPELAEEMSEVELAVVVDASVAAEEVVLRVVEPAPRPSQSHHGSASSLLHLAATAGYRVPPVYLLEVPASDVALGSELSEACREMVDGAVSVLVGLLAPNTEAGDGVGDVCCRAGSPAGP